MRVVYRTYGWRGLIRRIVHEVYSHFDLYHSTAKPLGDISTDSREAIYSPRKQWVDCSESLRRRSGLRAQQVIDGEYQAFGERYRTFPTTSLEWRRHPATGYQFPMDKWWRIKLLPAGHDVKDIWEPARFGWVYDVVREYRCTQDPKLIETFESVVKSWFEASPPFLGPHWACGQETAIRAIALLHAVYSLPLQQSKNGINELTDQILFWSGQRIADGIGYGLSQRNNHGISEAAGLIHIGAYFEGRVSGTEGWLRRGVKLINEQIIDQFSRDGWYAQHSFNYMRVALEQSIYAQRLLASLGFQLSPQALSRLKAAVVLLNHVVTPSNGRVPNHGANDGARVLPLSTADYSDFRPLLTLSACVLNTPLPSEMVPDEDVLQWLGCDAKAIEHTSNSGILQGESGWLSIRRQRSAVFVFAGSYRHRPSHLDLLHLHIKADDTELVTDAGTYSYNAAPPWNNALSSGLVHNGPIVNGTEPASRGPRFLWLSWPSAKIVEVSDLGDSIHVTLCRSGGVTREFWLFDNSVKVVDRLSDDVSGSLQVTWLLHPDAFERCRIVAKRAEMIEASDNASDNAVVAWYSPTYGTRIPSRAIRILQQETDENTEIRSEILFANSNQV